MRISFLLSGVVLLAALPACENQHVGRLCFIQRTTGEGSNVVVNPQALECPSRLCLHYPRDPGATGEESLDLCTADCTSDEDCKDAETSNNEGSCKTGFACAWPLQADVRLPGPGHHSRRRRDHHAERLRAHGREPAVLPEPLIWEPGEGSQALPRWNLPDKTRRFPRD
jgi:hypothetical protein